MSRDYCHHIADLLGAWGNVVSKAMFGGYGLYRDGQIFAIVADGVLYFKVDAGNRSDYEAVGSGPFTYEAANGKHAVMSYWQVPERVLDDADQLTTWAESAYQAALRAPKKPKRSKRVQAQRSMP